MYIYLPVLQLAQEIAARNRVFSDSEVAAREGGACAID